MLTQSRWPYLEACEDYRPALGLVCGRCREPGVKHCDARVVCNGIRLLFSKSVEQLLLSGVSANKSSDWGSAVGRLTLIAQHGSLTSELRSNYVNP